MLGRKETAANQLNILPLAFSRLRSAYSPQAEKTALHIETTGTHEISFAFVSINIQKLAASSF